MFVVLRWAMFARMRPEQIPEYMPTWGWVLVGVLASTLVVLGVIHLVQSRIRQGRGETSERPK